MESIKAKIRNFAAKSNKQILWVCVALVLVISAYLYWQATFPSGVWRYKITVIVETPEGKRLGSSVREVKAKINFAHFLNPDVKSISYESYGEALVIDLGGKGLLFSLVDWNSYSEFIKAFPSNANTAKEVIEFYNDLPLGVSVNLPKNSYPAFISFPNLKDPKSIQSVNPLHLENYFGKNVRLSSITIAATKEPLTHNIDQYLSPLDLKNDFWSWTLNLPYSDPRKVSLANFK